MPNENVLRPVRIVVQTDELRPAKLELASINEYPNYTGSYTVTPTQSTQTLNTKDKTMTGNVTVNPIPSNYGLVTWNGSVLTVS